MVVDWCCRHGVKQALKSAKAFRELPRSTARERLMLYSFFLTFVMTD